MRQDPNDEPNPATFPDEGQPELDLPGADPREPRPDPDDEPDLLPHLEVPDAQM